MYIYINVVGFADGFTVAVQSLSHTHTHEVVLEVLTIIGTTSLYRWPKCIECLKFEVSFRKRATNYRALLWK